MENFWQVLPKPFFCLAPMEAVTDVVFREMVAKYSSGEDIKLSFGYAKLNRFAVFTEFVNVDGLLAASGKMPSEISKEGAEKFLLDLKFTESQRPVVCQLWGTDPEKFFRAAELVREMGFDGVDINMGCPQDKEIGIGACAALIKNPKLAAEIIEATKKGAGNLPVSVKTRLGYQKIQTEEWIGHLLSCGLAAITLHARTQKEKSKVPAHWEEIQKAVKLRDAVFASDLSGKSANNFKTLIIGNGDVKSREEGLVRAAETGCDGVMIARGAFGNPWLFAQQRPEPEKRERLRVMLEHAELYEKNFLHLKPYEPMRKNFKAYSTGFEGAAELRARLMETKNAGETRQIVEEFLDL